MKPIKTIALTLLTVSALGASAFAGTTYVRHDDKKAVVPQEISTISLYGPEWTIDLFGTYAFTESTNERILGDHAFGGGLAVNRFFTTNLGVGIEGQALRTQRDGNDTVGSADLNLFYRMPLGQSGWAPYVYLGGGAIFNAAGQLDNNHNTVNGVIHTITNDNGNDTLFEGHAGLGVEYRITRHFGIFTDGRWTVVDGPKNNFPSVRTGVRFAF